MDREAKLELLALLEEKERRNRTRKLFTYYPDTGPLRRELYVKHNQFFEAGAKYRERLMLAANRVGKCISGDTLIESPDGTTTQVKEIKGRHIVWAWDGSKRVPAMAEAPFVKPSEMVYRVWLQTGQFVDCAAEHRFLTEAGWLFLSDLFGCVPCLPESTVGNGPAKSLEDVQYSMSKLPDSQVGCRPGCHSSDALPRCAQDNDQVFVPSQGDVQKHNPALSHLDALVGKCKSILSLFYGHLSNQYDARHFVGRSVGFLNLVDGNDEQSCLGSLQESQRPSNESASQPQSGDEVFVHQDAYIPAFITPNGERQHVLCYQPIGIQPIYDFHVPNYKNYCTAGFINHNTEGVGGFEMALHLTGNYPFWWAGRRFDKPISSWAAGDTGKTVREIIQFKLLGPYSDIGSGLIPKDLIVKTTPKQGIPEAVDTIYVKHASGGISEVALKSYDQKRYSFQGTEKDLIWLDEEPPLDIYTECLLRTMTNNGMLMLTFTPLQGMSETVMAFLPGGSVQELSEGSKFVVMATWDDAPHLSEEVKAELWNSIPPFQRDARSKGVPQLGAGAIYPVPESDFTVDDFPIPDHWPKVYGMDVGWNRTAVAWGAIDRDTDTLYLIGEHYRGQAEPSIHAQSIKAKGDWIPGVIDPASRGRTQRDGFQLLQDYKDLGLKVEIAFNGVESGLYEVWTRLSTGRMKVFKSMSNWLYEFRLYRRDEKGNIVKTNDHLMDATRYLVMSGVEKAKTKPIPKPKVLKTYSGGDGWMG